MSVASAVRWVKRFKAVQYHGRDFADAFRGHRRSGRIEAHRDYLLGLIWRRPDITLLEIKEQLIGNCGERFAVSVLWRFFDRHEITFKKTAHAEEQQRADVLDQTPGMVRRAARSRSDEAVFIDETGASTNVARKADIAGAGAGCGPPSRTVTTKR